MALHFMPKKGKVVDRELVLKYEEKKEKEGMGLCLERTNQSL